MKVLHILYELKFSGAEIMYVDAARYFQSQGCSLTVMSTSQSIGEFAPHFSKSGYNLIHKPFLRGRNIFKKIKYGREVIKSFKDEDFDVIHVHVNKFMLFFTFCAWIAGIKSVYTFHNVFPSRLHSFPYHVLRRFVAKNIFGCKFQSISDSVYEHELKYYFNRTKKIYNWYNSDRFYPAHLDERKHIREQLNISPDSLVLISIGGCSDIKRHSEIFKALPIICKRFHNTVYLHLGKGETEENEMELAKELGVSQNVLFLNNQVDVRKYLIASDVYVMPSKFEGISITTIEAMACGIPALLYNVPGLRDFNKNDENSTLIEEDYKLLAENVIYLFLNSQIAHSQSVRALNMVNTTYDLSINASQIYQLYLEE